MNRDEVQQWMHEHPESVHGAPETIISRCAGDLRRQGARAAWTRAREIVDREHHAWESKHGNHASPGFVAKEVCASLASKLRAMEPRLADGAECRDLDTETRAALESDAMVMIRPWLREVAEKEEHEEWLRIVDFTKKRGAAIAEDAHLSFDTRWESTWEYGEAAALVTELLSRDFAKHIR